MSNEFLGLHPTMMGHRYEKQTVTERLGKLGRTIVQGASNLLDATLERIAPHPSLERPKSVQQYSKRERPFSPDVNFAQHDIDAPYLKYDPDGPMDLNDGDEVLLIDTYDSEQPAAA